MAGNPPARPASLWKLRCKTANSRRRVWSAQPPPRAAAKREEENLLSENEAERQMDLMTTILRTRKLCGLAESTARVSSSVEQMKMMDAQSLDDPKSVSQLLIYPVDDINFKEACLVFFSKDFANRSHSS